MAIVAEGVHEREERFGGCDQAVQEHDRRLVRAGAATLQPGDADAIYNGAAALGRG